MMAKAGLEAALWDLLAKSKNISLSQMLGNEDIFDHSKPQRELKTPICLDESIHSPDDKRAAIKLDSGRIINIKSGRVPKKPGIGVEINMRMLEKVTVRSESFRS